jgi:CubicO group peptidase (beta-lactamase class C family)
MKTFFSIMVIHFVSVILFSCKILTPVYYNLPDEKDAKRFPYRTVLQAPDSAIFNFKKVSETPDIIKQIRVENKSINSTSVTLNQFVHLHKTISFAIIRNDSLLYEYYADNYSATKNVTSFSIAKSYITMLVGIAIYEGYIKSVNDPVTDYMKEWKDKPGYNLITIKDLLRHTSGLKFTENMFNPESDQLQFYYGTKLRKNILASTIREPPGLHFDYQSENPSLLALIIERTTGTTVSNYLQQKIWGQIGTEAPALWSTDRRDSAAIEKAFCCLNARTLDFAKFARLLLNKGNWNGRQIIPHQWIKESINRTTENGGKISYGYNMGIGPVAYNSFFPIGLYGQLLYIYPTKNIIIVRFGNADINYNPNYWKEIMLQLVDQL